jgi:hypothetical protein
MLNRLPKTKFQASNRSTPAFSRGPHKKNAPLFESNISSKALAALSVVCGEGMISSIERIAKVENFEKEQELKKRMDSHFEELLADFDADVDVY